MPIGSPSVSVSTGGGSSLSPGSGSTFGNVSSAILGSLPVVGSIFNAAETGIQNKKAREFQLQMYQMQRQDALADWQRQNEYNSPAQQMARLKAAGLNPNLVYGNGATAMSSSMPRQSSPGSPANRVPQIDPGSLTAYQDVRMKSAQMDLLQQQRQLMQQELDNKRIDQLLTIAKTDLTKSQRDLTDTTGQLKGVDLNYAVRTKETALAALEASVDKTNAQIRQIGAQTQFTLDENERRELRNGMSIKEAATHILQMRAQTIRTQYETENLLPQVKQKMIRQVQELDSQIDNLNQAAKMKGEQYRLLQSTPDWSDQKSIDMLGGILNGAMRRTTVDVKNYNR